MGVKARYSWPSNISARSKHQKLQRASCCGSLLGLCSFSSRYKKHPVVLLALPHHFLISPLTQSPVATCWSDRSWHDYNMQTVIYQHCMLYWKLTSATVKYIDVLQLFREHAQKHMHTTIQIICKNPYWEIQFFFSFFLNSLLAGFDNNFWSGFSCLKPNYNEQRFTSR